MMLDDRIPLDNGFVGPARVGNQRAGNRRERKKIEPPKSAALSRYGPDRCFRLTTVAAARSSNYFLPFFFGAAAFAAFFGAAFLAAFLAMIRPPMIKVSSGLQIESSHATINRFASPALPRSQPPDRLRCLPGIRARPTSSRVFFAATFPQLSESNRRWSHTL